MNTTQNDIKIEAAIIEARALLEEIPGVDSILGAWDVYCAHMDGPWVNVGPYPEDGYNSPNPQDQRIGLQILVGIYNRLAPFEDRIVSLFKILDFAKLPGLDEIVRNRLNYLNSYCSEFHTYQTTIMALGLLDSQEQQRKQPKRPKKQSKAAARLQSQELQEVKSKLIAAVIINDDGWQGTPAEFGCLVNELRDERGINDHGRRAWKEVAKWAGYHGNIESARSAIEKNIDTEGDVADKIRAICLANK